MATDSTQKREISLIKAEPGMKLAAPIHHSIGFGMEPMVVADIGTELDQSLINRLEIYDIATIEIFVQEAAPAPTHPTIKPDLIPENLEPGEPAVDEELKKEAIESIEKLFACFDVKHGGVLEKTTAEQWIGNVDKVLGELMEALSDDMEVLVYINGLKSSEEYTYHHSLSVAILSMCTGKKLGLSDDEVFRLGRCAVLHDIGKQMIPSNIINKKGKLTDTEFHNVKFHAVLGANTLKSNYIGDVELWNGIMYHHEKMNGSGYPKGLPGKDIPLFSKIISVSDAYDAITSHRSYRDPLSPSEAFEAINSGVGSSFDYDVVKAFFERVPTA